MQLKLIELRARKAQRDEEAKAKASLLEKAAAQPAKGKKKKLKRRRKGKKGKGKKKSITTDARMLQLSATKMVMEEELGYESRSSDEVYQHSVDSDEYENYPDSHRISSSSNDPREEDKDNQQPRLDDLLLYGESQSK